MGPYGKELALFEQNQTDIQPLFMHDNNLKLCSLWGRALELRTETNHKSMEAIKQEHGTTYL